MFENKKVFRIFLAEAFNKRPFSKDLKNTLIRVISTVLQKRNSDWIHFPEDISSLTDERCEVLLEAFESAVEYKYVEATDVYRLLKIVFRFLKDPKEYIPTNVHRALRTIVPYIHHLMTPSEKEGFYLHLGSSSVSTEVLNIIISDYKTKVIDKEFLIKTLLYLNVDKNAEPADRASYVELVSDATVVFLKDSKLHALHENLIPLIGKLSAEEFKNLASRVKEKLSGVLYDAILGPVKFLMYALNISPSLQISLPDNPYTKKRAIDLLLWNSFSLIPYLDDQKFWPFVEFVKSNVGERTAILAYLLNNDCIVKNEELTIKVLKIYLNTDKYKKLDKHKLLLDAKVVASLSQEQSVELARRAVDYWTSTKFKFTKAAFDIVRTRVMSAILADSSPELKSQYERFVSLCEIID